MRNIPRVREALLCALSLSGLCVAVYKEFYYIKTRQTWTQAQSFCRQRYSDLVAVESADENAVISGFNDPFRLAWIGYFDDRRKWRWSLGNAAFDNDVDFEYWDLEEPYDQRLGNVCVVVTESNYWYDTPCDNLRYAVCYNEKGLVNYIFVDVFMTWYQARDYCRSHFTDLVSIRSSYDMQVVSQVVKSGAWIGLHREPWAWSDASNSTYANWGSVGSVPGMTACAVADMGTGLWHQADCGNLNNVVCQVVASSTSGASTNLDDAATTTAAAAATTTYKLKFRSEKDLHDPDVQQQMLKQLQDKLMERLMPSFKLRWTHTKRPKVTKERSDDKCSPVYS